MTFSDFMQRIKKGILKRKLIKYAMKISNSCKDKHVYHNGCKDCPLSVKIKLSQGYDYTMTCLFWLHSPEDIRQELKNKRSEK